MSVLQFYFGVCGHPQGFRLYNEASGELIAEAGVDDRSLDLSSLGLPAGRYTLDLSYVDAWGSESERATTEIEIHDGAPLQELTPPTELATRALAGGVVELSFRSINRDRAFRTPAEYEIAEASNPGVILGTLTHEGSAIVEVELGPFAHDQTVWLLVRASDGEVDGQRGPWVEAPAVVADAFGPAAPELFLEPRACECGG